MDPELLKRLDALAEKVGQTGERLFASLVEREVVSAWWGIGSTLLSVVPLLIVGVKLGLYAKRLIDDERDWEFPAMFAVLALFLGAMLLVVNVPKDAVSLSYPEAAALKTLLGK